MTRPYCPTHVEEAHGIVNFGVKSFVAFLVVLFIQVVATVGVVVIAVKVGRPLWGVLAWLVVAVVVGLVGHLQWRRSVRQRVSRRIDVLALKVSDCAACLRRRNQRTPRLVEGAVVLDEVHDMDPATLARLDQVLRDFDDSEPGYFERAWLDQPVDSEFNPNKKETP